MVCCLRTFGGARLRLVSKHSLARCLLTLKTSCENCASFMATPSTADLAVSALCLPILVVDTQRRVCYARGRGLGYGEGNERYAMAIYATTWGCDKPRATNMPRERQPSLGVAAYAWRLGGGRGGSEGNSAGAALGVDAHPWSASRRTWRTLRRRCRARRKSRRRSTCPSR